jgi:hypothetical protein
MILRIKNHEDDDTDECRHTASLDLMTYTDSDISLNDSKFDKCREPLSFFGCMIRICDCFFNYYVIIAFLSFFYFF